jgi:hypothetical protein
LFYATLISFSVFESPLRERLLKTPLSNLYRKESGHEDGGVGGGTGRRKPVQKTIMVKSVARTNTSLAGPARRLRASLSLVLMRVEEF